MTKTVEKTMKEFFGTGDIIEYITVGDTRDFLDDTYTTLSESKGNKTDHEKTLQGLYSKLKEFGATLESVIEIENVTYIIYK